MSTGTAGSPHPWGRLGPRDIQDPHAGTPQCEASLPGLPRGEWGRPSPPCACAQDKAVAEPVSRLLESALRSSHLPSTLGALHGVLYVLECDLLDDTAKQLVPVVSDYLLSHLQGRAQ